MRITHVRKFFGQPNGSSPKPQQSKLAFQKPHSTKAAKDKPTEVDGLMKTEDGEEVKGVKKDKASEDVNMDSDLDENRSAMESERAGLVVNGIGKGDPPLANGKGELSCKVLATHQIIDNVKTKQAMPNMSLQEFRLRQAAHHP